MKKFILTLANVLLLCGCTNREEPVVPLNDEGESQEVQIRTPAEALAIAAQYCNATGENDSRSEGRTVGGNSISVIQGTESRGVSDTLMYAVDFADNEGFMIVSANKAVEPILAIIDKGNYQESIAGKNKGFEIFMEYAKKYSSNVPKKTISSSSEDFLMAEKRDTTYMTSGSWRPKVPVEWNQRWPENMFAPNLVAGCVPVAMAQVLTAIKPELSLPLTFDGRPYDTLNPNWTEIIKHKKSSETYKPFDLKIQLHLNGCSSMEYHIQIGALVRQMGVLVNAIYNGTPDDPQNNSTGANTFSGVSHVVALLPEYGYESVSPRRLYEFLGDDVAMVRGKAFIPYPNGQFDYVGHCWVADATFCLTRIINIYYTYNPKTGEYESRDIEKEERHYVHFNWGWGGNSNGFFLENVFESDEGTTEPSFVKSRYNFKDELEGYVIKRK